MTSPTSTTLRQTWTEWLAAARDGSVRKRGGGNYKPSVLRSYETSMRLRLLGDLGAVKVSDVTRRDLQDIAERMLRDGLDASTIRNTFIPLRALFRRAVSRGDLAVSPTDGLELPAVEGRRDRIASPEEAAKLLAALPEAERALWATAAYAGLRLGELRALRVEDVDLEAGVTRVEWSWDPREGQIEPKSRAGRRRVPIVAALRPHLAAHLLRCPWREGRIFGRTADEPFNPGTANNRAAKAWKDLEPIGLHEFRHTFVSTFIAAGVNAKALSSYLGHSSIQITFDRYGHLLPGNEEEAATLVDQHLRDKCATVGTPAERIPAGSGG